MKRPILLSLLVSAGLPAALLTCLPATAQVTSNDEALPQAAPKPASKQVAQGRSAHEKNVPRRRKKRLRTMRLPKRLSAQRRPIPPLHLACLRQNVLAPLPTFLLIRPARS